MGVIDNIIQDKADIKNQIGSSPSYYPTLKNFTNVMTPKTIVSKYIQRKYNSNNNFVLNSSSFGVLGTNKLGANDYTDLLKYVLPNNNIFIEYFAQSNYINTTNSTGSIDTTNESYTLSNQILESEVVCKPQGPINAIKFVDNLNIVDNGTGMVLPLTLGVSTFLYYNSQIEVSNDGGATWYGVNEGEYFEFPTTTNDDELKYRVNGTVVINTPIIIAINEQALL